MPRKRGEYGQGSVYQLKDGRWRAALSSIGPDGKRKRRTAVRDDYRAALRALKELRKDRSDGVTHTTNPTVAEYLATWLETVESSVRPRASRCLPFTTPASFGSGATGRGWDG